MNATLATLLEDQAQHTPDRLAVHLYRGEGWTRWSGVSTGTTRRPQQRAFARPSEERVALENCLRDAFEVRGITLDRIVLVAPGTLPKTTSGKLKRVEVALTLARQNRCERSRPE